MLKPLVREVPARRRDDLTRPVAIVLASLVGIGLILSAPTRMSCHRSRTELQRPALRDYAQDAYPRWRRAHPVRTCPDSIEELRVYARFPDRNSHDRWGRPFRIHCDLPRSLDSSGFGIASAGPDGRFGTADDVESWKTEAVPGAGDAPGK